MEPTGAAMNPAGPPVAEAATRGALGYAEVLFVTMAAATTDLLYDGFFATRSYLLPVLVAAAGAAALAALAATRRWRAGPSAFLAVAGFALVAVLLVYRRTFEHGLPTADTATGLGSGLLHGWARMLSVGVPADATPDLLITPVLLTWAAAFVATTLALRTRVPLVPVLPTLLALVAGLLLTAVAPASGLLVTAAYLVETLLLVVVRVARLELASAVPQADAQVVGVRQRRLAGRLGFGVVLAAVIATAGVAGTTWVPVAAGADRFDPRTVAPQRFSVADTVTPLATVKSQLLAKPAQKLFTLHVTVGTEVPLQLIRTAALDNFDGALWTADDAFLVAGHTLQADPDLTHMRLVSAQIDVQNLTGPYLPVLGWPIQVDAAGLGFSASSGVLVSSGPELHGLRYGTVGEVPVRDGLASAVPSLVGAAARDTQLPPGLPPELLNEANALTATAASPYDKLTAIENYLRTLPYRLDARPGHSYDALRRLFSSNSQDRVGTAEQFAAAFAVMARSQGFPARVAVGYKLPPRSGADTYQVTTANAHAWAEVYFTGYGWVSFDPTDPTRRPVDTNQQQPQTEPGAVDQPGDTQNPGTQPLVDERLRAGGGGRRALLTGAVLLAVALGVLLVLLLFGVGAEKVRRRYARRTGGGNERIVGAWREVTDRLVERGVAVPRSLTAGEAAVYATERLGEPARAVAVLAPLVSAATFQPWAASEDEVREAWELSGQFRRDLRRARGIRRAVLAWFNPRPLWYGWRDGRRRRRGLKRMQGG
jgi:Transglutaminase-like superfamily/TgpA N-terminal domain